MAFSPTDIRRMWKKTLAAYKAVGLNASRRRKWTKNGVVYESGVVCLRHETNPWTALHDLCHWLVAEDFIRGDANFGLGPTDIVVEKGREYAENQRYYDLRETAEIEYKALVCQHHLVKMLFGDVALECLRRDFYTQPEDFREDYEFDINDIDFTPFQGL